MRCLAVLVVIVVACGGDAPKKPDASIDAYFSNCGHPGDMGNELGVGFFCPNGLADCANTPNAHLCSSLGDMTTHFCTFMCTMGSAGQCGTGAECVCDGPNRCGCTPSVCLR